MKIRSVSKTVEKMLLADPRTRDSDNWLIARIWSLELKSKGMDTKALTTSEFLRRFATESIVSSAESIRRCRQKLQERNKELRGNSYTSRHEALEPKVRQQVIEWQ